MYKILGSDGQEYGLVPAAKIKQWISEGRVEKNTPVFPNGGEDWGFLGSLPEFSEAFASPSPVTVPGAAAKSGGGLNAVIPYKNIRALFAYYLAVFSVVPILGMPLGLAGFVLGILGLRFSGKNPSAGGKVHAWIGIVLGGLFGFGYLALIILGLVMAVAGKHKIY